MDERYDEGYRWGFHKLAIQYAKAVHELLRDEDEQLAHFQCLCYCACLALRDHHLRWVLMDSSVRIDDRISLLLDCALMQQPTRLVCSPKVTEVISGLGRLLLQRRQIVYLPNVLACYQEQCWRQYGICRVRAWSMIELTMQQRRLIENCIAERYHLRTRLQCYLMPEMLGGIILEVFDRRIDNSVSSILKRLRLFLDNI